MREIQLHYWSEYTKIEDYNSLKSILLEKKDIWLSIFALKRWENPWYPDFSEYNAIREIAKTNLKDFIVHSIQRITYREPKANIQVLFFPTSKDVIVSMYNELIENSDITNSFINSIYRTIDIGFLDCSLVSWEKQIMAWFWWWDSAYWNITQRLGSVKVDQKFDYTIVVDDILWTGASLWRIIQLLNKKWIWKLCFLYFVKDKGFSKRTKLELGLFHTKSFDYYNGKWVYPFPLSSFIINSSLNEWNEINIDDIPF